MNIEAERIYILRFSLAELYFCILLSLVFGTRRLTSAYTTPSMEQIDTAGINYSI